MSATNEASPAANGGDLERLVSSLLEIEKYLREEADFNRSWIDGRRGAGMPVTAEYVAHRLEIANQRCEWADAIAKIVAKAPIATLEELRQMPVVTVEQVIRFREAAFAALSERDRYDG